MKISIGDNNKIKNSNIGIRKNAVGKTTNKLFVDIIKGLAITVIGGIIVGVILYHILK